MKTTKIQFNGRSYYPASWNPSMAKNCLSVRQSLPSMPCSPAVSMTRTKVLPVKKPKGFMTRFSSLPTRERFSFPKTS